jgi:hypothetical protein
MLTLNEKQQKVRKSLTKFLAGPDEKFLILGMAGSGKTTVIVNTFNETKLYVAFCAFTNKATQVLSKISSKFDVKFSSQFMTIHQLLALEIKYDSSEVDIHFNFKLDKAVANMSAFDVIIFDECSTISTELYTFINKTQSHIRDEMGKTIKYIFVGDYWQLPPVNEKSAIVFDRATRNNWPISKLDVIMRSNNDAIRSININMLSWIPRFKSKDPEDTEDFVRDYPYNLISRESGAYIRPCDFVYHYIDTWHNKTPDCVILTCSRKNCTKINIDVQHILNERRHTSQSQPITASLNGQPPIPQLSNQNPPIITAPINTMPENMTYPIYMPGDRITLVRPISLYGITRGEEITVLNSQLPTTLYNGEIFDVMECLKVKLKTELNKYDFVAPYFEAYKLTIRRINTDVNYEIMYIPEVFIDDARTKLKNRLYWREFLNLMTEFIKKYPKIDYGYCMTIYKSQGSEWNTVYVNVNNLKWCMVGGDDDATASKKIQLFKNTYTAISRASNEVYCSW